VAKNSAKEEACGEKTKKRNVCVAILRLFGQIASFVISIFGSSGDGRSPMPRKMDVPPILCMFAVTARGRVHMREICTLNSNWLKCRTFARSLFEPGAGDRDAQNKFFAPVAQPESARFVP
jgi:hypothetical protein